MYRVKTRMKKSILLFFMLVATLVAHGQNIQVLMDAPGSVGIDEQFQLNITINANPASFTPPNLNDFQVLMGPSTSSSSNIQIINNKMTQSYEYTYSYVLQARKSGKFTLSAAQFTVGSKKFSSNNITIEVTGTASNSKSGSGSSSPSTSSNQTVDESGAFFLKIFLDKKSVYQGEFITATVKLYSQYRVVQVANLIMPNFDGFYKQDIQIPQLRSLNRENINGKTYQTGVISKFIIIPQKAGNLRIGSGSMNCVIQIQTRGGGGFFDDFFSQVENVEKQAKSAPFTVEVKPLTSRPASFTGAVGKFNFTASYDKTKVNANDPVILKLDIQGAGNLKLIEAPKIDFPDGIETSEPTVNSKINDRDGGISGTKQFEYLLIPRAPGKMTLPPIEFSYFDPVAKQFKTISSPSVTLDVNPGNNNGTVAANQGISKEDVQFLGKDIQYIKLNGISLRKKGNVLFGSIFFYSGYLVSLLLFGGILIWRRNYIKQSSNAVLSKNRKAQKYAISRLKKAKEFLVHSKKENFYEEVLGALWGYISDKLNIPVSDLSRDYARVQLLHANIEEGLVQRTMDLIDTCEYARYAPATSDNTMENDYKEAVSIITQIQEKIR